MTKVTISSPPKDKRAIELGDPVDIVVTWDIGDPGAGTATATAENGTAVTIRLTLEDTGRAFSGEFSSLGLGTWTLSASLQFGSRKVSANDIAIQVLDTVAPKLVAQKPVGGQYEIPVDGMWVAVELEASDLSGVDTVQARIDANGPVATLTGPVANGIWSGQVWCTGRLGMRSVQGNATDGVGKSTEWVDLSSFNAVRTAGPQVTISSPPKDKRTIELGDPVDIVVTWDIGDPGAGTATATAENGTAVTIPLTLEDTGRAFSGEFSSLGLGTWTLSASLQFGSRKVSANDIAIQVLDTVAPKLVAQKPVGGQYEIPVDGMWVAVELEASDLSGVDTVQARIDANGPVATLTGPVANGIWSGQVWCTGRLGIRSVQGNATDGVGKSTEWVDLVSFNAVRDVAPTVTLSDPEAESVFAPDGDVGVSGFWDKGSPSSGTATATASDGTTKVTSLQLEDDASIFSGHFGPLGLGAWSLVAELTFGTKSISSDSVDIDVRDRHPVVTVLEPTNDAGININPAGSEIAVRVRATAFGVVDAVKASITGSGLPPQALTRSTTDPEEWSGTVHCPGSFLGHQAVEVGATSGAFSSVLALGTWFGIDTTRPTVKILGPAGGSSISLPNGSATASIPVHLRAGDSQSGLASVECQLLDAEGQVVQGGTARQVFTVAVADWTGVLTLQAAPGIYSIKAVATDRQGHAEVTTDAVQGIEVAPIDNAVDPDSVLAVLLERRPDLAEIELSCENSETPVPYLDLVLEVLETAAGEPFPQAVHLDAADLSAATHALDTGSVTVALIGAIKTVVPPLSGHATSAVLKAGTEWTVKDGARRLGLRMQSQGLVVAWYAPQTAAGPGSNGVQPEHFNASAYAALRETVYPASLPFDLWTEDARVQLAHLGMPHHALKLNFYRGAGWQQAEIGGPGIRHWRTAASRLGVGEIELRIIDGSLRGAPAVDGSRHGPWNFWGMSTRSLDETHSIPDPADRMRRISSGSWPGLLTGRLDVLLQQSGLDYQELEQLLDMHFVNKRANGDRILAIQLGVHKTATLPPTESFDLSLASLVAAGHASTGDEEHVLMRLHRFVRLWRSLGWPMPDVDRALLLQVTEDPATPYSVHGMLTDIQGLPLAGLTVSAVDQDFGASKNDLGSAVTDAHGHYRITFPASAYRKGSGEVEGPDLILHVLDAHDQLIGQSNRHRSAARVTLLNLSIDLTAKTVTEQWPVGDRAPTAGESLLAAIDWTRTALTERLQLPDIFQSTALLDTNRYLDFGRPGRPALPSAYESVYLRTGLTPAPGVFQLKSGRREIVGAGQPASPHLSHIASACGLTMREAQMLLDDESAGTLSLPTLSHLYFGARAARTAGLSVWEFLALRRLAANGVNFEGLATADTVAADAARALADVGMPAAEAIHLLTHRAERDTPERQMPQIVNLLTDLRAALAKIDTQTMLPPDGADPDGRLVRAEIQRLGWDAGVIAEVMTLLSRNGTVLNADEQALLARHLSSYGVVDHSAELDAGVAATLAIPARLNARCFYDKTSGRLHFLGSMTVADLAELTALSADGRYASAISALLRDPAPQSEAFIDSAGLASLLAITKSAGRFAFLLTKLLAYRRRTASSAEVANRLGDAFALEAGSVRRLLGEWLSTARDGRDAKVPALQDFLDPSFAASPPDLPVTEGRFPAAFRSCVRLGKIQSLTQRFGFSQSTLPWIFRPAMLDRGWLNLNMLPASDGEPAAALAGLLRLANLAQLLRRMPGGERSIGLIFELASAADTTVEALPGRVCTLTGWARADLQELLSPAGFDLGTPDRLRQAFADEWLLLRLVDCFVAMSRLGASARQCLSWANQPIGSAQATEIRDAVRARHGDAAWLKAAKPLRDALREKQRNALVDHLVAKQGLRNGNDLHGHYLIDVEMGAAAMTSRIKQACASVQLFVQRCLLNLEPNVAPDAIDTQLWDWMKNFRVWEANRKIFLYPENWLEPELRDDKTPLFREFESALLQDDIDTAHAEANLRDYLDALCDLAKVDIRAMAQDEQNGVQALHLIGRTRAAPHVWHHRAATAVPGTPAWTWSPWAKIKPNIESDFVLPVARNGRLFVFWPTMTERMSEPSDATGAKSLRYQEIALSSAVLSDGRWGPKSVARQTVGTWPDNLSIRQQQLLFDGSLQRSNNDGERILVSAKSIWKAIKGNTIARTEGMFFYYLDSGDVQSQDDDTPVKGSYDDDDLGLSIAREYTYWNQVGRLQSVGATNPFRLRFDQLEVVLGDTPRPFKLVVDWPQRLVRADKAVVFQDSSFAFVLTPLASESGGTARLTLASVSHPAIDSIQARWRSGGSAALFSLDSQKVARWNLAGYRPSELVSTSDLENWVDFRATGSYATYNWELFFHSALHIATSLSRNQRFAEAKRWFEYIFDPTSNSADPSPNRFWRFLPFHDAGKPPSLGEWLTRLAEGDPALRSAVDDWRRHPFEPHRVARLRPSAYQWSVVMKYLDNLIAWADQLFRGDTIESINEATQLYVLAAEMLGSRPRRIAPDRSAPAQSFNQINGQLDSFSNALVRLESMVPADVEATPASSNVGALPTLYGEYFCVPPNEQLVGYWDTAEDRLFKIRHSMNLQGVVRKLPLYEPPLDPGLLVRAAAAGLDVSAVLQESAAPMPPYRFGVMLQKALELCGEVKSLGSALLSALEKRDAERLSLLRATQENGLLKLIEDVKQSQMDEAAAQRVALRQSRETAVVRFMHFEKLLGITAPAAPKEGDTIAMALEPAGAQIQDAAGLKVLKYEVEEATSLAQANDQQLAAGFADMLASYLRLIPESTAGFGGSGSTFGGANLGQAASIFAGVFRTGAGQSSFQAARAARQAGLLLRENEWVIQRNQAAHDIMQIDKQVIAADLRSDIAAKELASHLKQMENSQATEELLRGKFTAEELYAFMVGQISSLHFQCYQLAYDLAQRAERTFRRELAIDTSAGSFVRFGYWDSLKKGLLAGERLALDLRRLEVAFHDLNRRELEMVRHISLRRLDPEQLVLLRTTGRCEFSVPEWLFDLDAPGQYLRRLKAVSLSIPCVVGPYGGVFCKLTLLSSRVRNSTSPSGDFTEYLGAMESIVTSSGSADSGLFETNLREERYLPFEGAGALSNWRLELPDPALAQFDYASVSDVVMHLRYTARDGGADLRAHAVQNVKKVIQRPGAAAILVNIKQEFPSEWARAAAAQTSAHLVISLSADMLPYVLASTTKRQGVRIFDPRLDTLTGQPIGFRVLDNDPGPGALTSEIDIGTVVALLDASGGTDPLLLFELGGA